MKENQIKPRIIGGMFGLSDMPHPNSTAPLFLNEKDILLANASSGILLLVDLLSPAQVWMPSYLCDSMLKAIDNRAVAVKFYEVNYDLDLSRWKWLDEVKQNDLVIFIDYFGFPYDTSWVSILKEKGAWLLEDASQALLSKGNGQNSDFVLFSPRKFLGVPDGGILRFNGQGSQFDAIELKTPPAQWWLKIFSATVLRREFDLHGGDRRWFELFRETEVENPLGAYAMSQLTKMLLRQGFDYPAIARRRIENYHFLAQALSDMALFPTLPANVVPLGFPIRLKNRDKVRQILFDQNIYPPVHWPIQDIVPQEFNDSHRLAAEIMTLPCDQRYDNQNMERMARVIQEALK